MRTTCVLAAVVVLSGCGGAAVEAEPAWFTDRQPLPTCDAVVLDQGDVVPGSAADCLFDRDTESGAELAVRSPTTEGDPVYTYYRRPPGAAAGMDVMSDATRDRNGVEGWRWVTCPQAASLTDLGDCTVRAVEPRRG